jgi:hypothetical protein
MVPFTPISPFPLCEAMLGCCTAVGWRRRLEPHLCCYGLRAPSHSHAPCGCRCRISSFAMRLYPSTYIRAHGRIIADNGGACSMQPRKKELSVAKTCHATRNGAARTHVQRNRRGAKRSQGEGTRAHPGKISRTSTRTHCCREPKLPASSNAKVCGGRPRLAGWTRLAPGVAAQLLLLPERPNPTQPTPNTQHLNAQSASASGHAVGGEIGERRA